jgi:hypothetical protein
LWLCCFFGSLFFASLSLWLLQAWGSAKETPLEVTLNRSHMVYDSIDFVSRLTPGQLRTRFKIVYRGETGIDSGGLTKDWYLELSRSMMSR